MWSCEQYVGTDYIISVVHSTHISNDYGLDESLLRAQAMLIDLCTLQDGNALYLPWSDVEDKFVNRFFPPSRYIEAKAEISTFRQGPDKPFCEAWEQFNSLLRRCLHHGFEDIAQLNIFCNGLRPDTKMILDAAAGGTMMSVEAEQATIIIEALASTDHQAQHNRQTVQRKGMLDLSTTDAILAQNKILTQQMEALTKQMANLPEQLKAVQSSPSQQQPMRCNFCGGDHPDGHWVENNQGQNFGWKQDAGPSHRQPPYQHQQQNPSVYERTAKLEDTLEKFIQASITNQKNTEASIINLETQVGQLAKQLSDQQAGHFLANTQTNPKEHCKSITTRSGKIVGRGIRDNLVVEEEVLERKENKKEKNECKGEEEKNKSEYVNKREEKNRNKEKKREKGEKQVPQLKNLPYPQNPSKKDKERQFARFMDIFKRLQINIPFVEAMEQMPTYAKFMKDLLTKKKDFLKKQKSLKQGAVL
ncbi:hypothetical protein VNO78_15726 [Psophocarpus tetragonolobus]|uniref:Retrotransposon gag domain-containing protein n=1 Tax=Psophocarpus tetragonolobus TaxID=3891 RepID=A0AAN9SGJ8_PSOTE